MTESIKKLYKSSDDSIIAGVAGGIGEYFSIDPLFVRLVFVLLALMHGLGVLLYIIFFIIVPKEGHEHTTSDKIKEIADDAGEKAKKVTEKIEKNGKDWTHNRTKIIGLVILLVGVFALLNEVISISWFKWDIFWRVSLIVVGFYLLVKTDNKKKTTLSE